MNPAADIHHIIFFRNAQTGHIDFCILPPFDTYSS